MTSRRRWEHPRQKNKYQAQSLKLGNYLIQDCLQKRMKKVSRRDQKLMNYFRNWKKLTNIESSRYRQQKLMSTFKRLTNKIQTQKIVYLYKWKYYDPNPTQKDSQEDLTDHFNQIINQNVIKSQSMVNEALSLQLNKHREKYKQVRYTNLITNLMLKRFRPKYEKKIHKFFNYWKKLVQATQRFELQ